MNERTLRLIFGRYMLAARASQLAAQAAPKIRAGAICYSCRAALPQPHSPGRKCCETCANRHHVRMTFHHSYGWHCRFFSKSWRAFPKRFIFRDAALIRETAKRGNGLIDAAACEYLEMAIELGRGGIMLRLTDEQFQAIGGVLPSAGELSASKNRKS